MHSKAIIIHDVDGIRLEAQASLFLTKKRAKALSVSLVAFVLVVLPSNFPAISNTISDYIMLVQN